jgi:uncharacterized protein (TIGR00251 family)
MILEGASSLAVKIDVIIQPKSSRNEIVGMQGDCLKIKLTAPPVDGKANAALIAFLAKKLGIPKSNITIVRGKNSRRKTIELYGVSHENLFTK